ncbi:class II aldolase/adducin family protein [Streptomyces sp. NPDC059874]|uniref:class II aldolase/adducin family protein n=1 Tax=Streptomyces sp. NPDC059874 TaxID=3346983 RepID=UPI0036478972
MPWWSACLTDRSSRPSSTSTRTPSSSASYPPPGTHCARLGPAVLRGLARGTAHRRSRRARRIRRRPAYVINAVEGDHAPSSDTAAQAYVYRHLPEAGGGVHTHSNYVCAWAAGTALEAGPPPTGPGDLNPPLPEGRGFPTLQG